MPEPHRIDLCVGEKVERIGVGRAFGLARVAQDRQRAGNTAQGVAAGSAGNEGQQDLQPGSAKELRLGIAMRDMAELVSDNARQLIGSGRRLDQLAGHDDPPTRQRECVDHWQVVDRDRKGREACVTFSEPAFEAIQARSALARLAFLCAASK